MSVVDGLRKLEAAATPGPWFARHIVSDEWIVMASMEGGNESGYPGAELSGVRAGNEAALIAAMRNALPLLLDVVEKAEAVANVKVPTSGLLGAALINLDFALDALESAQGAEQRPETGAGA